MPRASGGSCQTCQHGLAIGPGVPGHLGARFPHWSFPSPSSLTMTFLEHPSHHMNISWCLGCVPPVPTAVGHWLPLPALAIHSSDTCDDNLMLQALSPPSSIASMPLQPGLNSTELQHASTPRLTVPHQHQSPRDLHLLSIRARGLGSLTLHLGELGHSIFLTCCLHGSITKIFTSSRDSAQTSTLTRVLSDPRERWNSQVQQASKAASHPPLQHVASSVPGSLTAPCPTGCPWVAASRREGRLNKRESAGMCSTKTLGQQY